MWISVFYLLASAIMNFKNSVPPPPVINDIKIELRLDPSQLKDSGTVKYGTADIEKKLNPKIHAELKKPVNGLVRINMHIDGPSYIDFSNILNIKRRGHYLVEFGDSILITSNGEGFHFSGNGAAKYRLQYQLDSLDHNTPKPNNKRGSATLHIDSIAEYYQFERYYEHMIDLGLELLSGYKGMMSEYMFNRIKDGYIHDVIGDLAGKFDAVKMYVAFRKMSAEKIVRVYDSSYSELVQRWVNLTLNKQNIELGLKINQIERAYGFDILRMPTQKERLVNYYEDGLKVFKGEQRERFIIDWLPNLMMKVGFTSEVEKLITDYYSEPGFLESKSRIKKQEQAIRIKNLGYLTPGFILPDAHGNLISNENLKGKILILNFQNSDSSIGKSSSKFLDKSLPVFKNNPELVLINIYTEKNNVTRQKNLSEVNIHGINSINVSTGGLGVEHTVVRDYAIKSYPWIWIMDVDGKILNASPLIDLTKDNGELLVRIIKKEIDKNYVERQKAISYRKDGPYVFHEGNTSVSYSIDNERLGKVNIDNSKREILGVQTDLDKTFSVHLQKSFVVEPAVYPEVDKLLVFSDIEGNFDAFRKLLQSNKVIDSNFNWIFGKGHLVFAGDMFDRGMQVTECLWLMYSLEEKAKAKGGYVHFVLGNHDIMNMQGNHRYTTKKYADNAALMGKKLTELYNESSEIGRWLRTKNVIEKIGGLLFVHGGISPEVNNLPVDIEAINRIARPYYGKTIDSSNKDLMTIYDSRKGEAYRISPFWSRSYYKGVKLSTEQLNFTLNKFDVQRIITGHTIVADTISLHYDGKVINTDTKHAKGKSEALLIENERYYRVNDKGDKVLLFVDEKTKRSN